MNRNKLSVAVGDFTRNAAAKVGTASVLALTAVGSAMASTDPTTNIIAEIDKGKGYGVAAAVAFAVAVWAIRAIAMARRKG